jgi:4-amino-4-deoxy-L-arabinose transferase-like glycosyltransferase
VAPARRPTILLAFLAVAAFLPFLGRRDIVTSHEARVVQTARQMAESGYPWHATPIPVPAVHLTDAAGAVSLDPDLSKPPIHLNPWLVPVLNDEIRLQKPPLPYWCSAILFKLAGHWSEALARLIPALMGALATFLTYDLTRLVLGRRYALAAALVWVTSYFIPDEFRKVMADPYLAFFSLLAVWAWIRAASRRFTSPSPHLPILIFYLATALGLLAKGPPLFIHLIIPIALFHLLKKRRLPGPLWSHLLGIALLLLIALPWPIYIINHVPNAREIWRHESIGEITDNIDNARPFWFYFPLLFQITLPWTPLWLLAFWVVFRRRKWVQGSEFRVQEEPNPQSTDEESNPQSTARLSSPKSIRNRQSLLPLAWYALTVLFFSCVRMKKLAYLLPAMPAQTMMIAQAAVFCGVVLRKRTGRTRRQLDETFIFACTLIVIILIGVFNFIQTPMQNARSPRRAAAFLELALNANPHATTIPARLPPEASLYLPLSLTYNPQADTILYLVDDLHNTAKADLDVFASRLPNLNLTAVRRMPIPGDGARPRYKLFELTLAPGQPKNYASASTPQPPTYGPASADVLLFSKDSVR